MIEKERERERERDFVRECPYVSLSSVRYPTRVKTLRREREEKKKTSTGCGKLSLILRHTRTQKSVPYNMHTTHIYTYVCASKKKKKKSADSQEHSN